MICPNCKIEMKFNKFCGAYTCYKCKYHHNLARCFCGWNSSSQEPLPDDIGESKFNGESWEVAY